MSSPFLWLMNRGTQVAPPDTQNPAEQMPSGVLKSLRQAIELSAICLQFRRLIY